MHEQNRHSLILLSGSTSDQLEEVTEHAIQRLQAVALRSGQILDLRLKPDSRFRRVAILYPDRDALKTLTERDPNFLLSGPLSGETPRLVFMFPGQGASHHLNTTRDLLLNNCSFRGFFEQVSNISERYYEANLVQMITMNDSNAMDALADQTDVLQPILFAAYYAAASVLLSWGVKPEALIGHSFGEWAAAHLAGVVSLEDAAWLVIERGRLMKAAPEGAMLMVLAGYADVAPFCRNSVGIAASNSPKQTVISGTPADIEDVSAALAASRVKFIKIPVSRAGHSMLMDPIIPEFKQAVWKCTLREPKIPFISGATGSWISKEDAISPEYWASHIKRTVWFSKGVETLVKSGPYLCVEVGPGTRLVDLIEANDQERCLTTDSITANSSVHSNRYDALLHLAARIWVRGCPVDWNAVSADLSRCS